MWEIEFELAARCDRSPSTDSQTIFISFWLVQEDCFRETSSFQTCSFPRGNELKRAFSDDISKSARYIEYWILSSGATCWIICSRHITPSGQASVPSLERIYRARSHSLELELELIQAHMAQKAIGVGRSVRTCGAQKVRACCALSGLSHAALVGVYEVFIAVRSSS